LTRVAVETLAKHGVPQTDVARLLEIAPKTLRLRYREQLDRGSALATAEVAANLMRFARRSGSNLLAQGASRLERIGAMNPRAAVPKVSDRRPP
jgi:hypothetical protein